MRTIWLASTALLITTGIACAQSATTSAPAPTGAISASPGAPSSSASPGNMAPSSSGSGMPMASSAAPSNGVSSPAPNGAASAPDVTANAPGASPGKMAPSPNQGNASNTMAASPSSESDQAMSSSTHPWHHHWSHSGSMTLPEDASATTYLHIAKSAIGHHNTSLADDALSHAETRLLDRSVPQGQITADSSPSIQSIENARQALRAGDYTQASADTREAASSVSGI